MTHPHSSRPRRQRVTRLTAAAISVAALTLLSACGQAPTTGPTGATSTPATTITPAARTATSAPTGSTSAPTAPTSSAQSTHPVVAATAHTGPAECTTSQLRARLVPAGAGAGQRYGALVLTNTSPVSCFVIGYPGLQLRNGAGAALPTSAVRSGASATRVSLAAGASASSLLHWTVVPGAGEPTDVPCQPTATTLAVIPPDQTSSVHTPWTGEPVCLHGRIDIGPLHTGATAQP